MALVGQAVSEEKIFEIVDGRTTDGRKPDHGHPISSPCEPNGSGELKNATMEFSYFFHIDVLNAPPSEYAKIFLDYRISF